MILLNDLTKKAKDILEEAYPLRKDWDNRDFVEAYKNFMKETNMEYKDLGFNGFQVAIKRYKQAQARVKILDSETYHPEYKSLGAYVEHKRREAVDEHYRG